MDQMTMPQAAPVTQRRSGGVAEIFTFRLKPGATADAFADAARNTLPVLRAQGGFIRRRLSLGADGLWTDWIEWQDTESAQAAMAAVETAAPFGPFMAMIDERSLVMRHDPIIVETD